MIKRNGRYAALILAGTMMLMTAFTGCGDKAQGGSAADPSKSEPQSSEQISAGESENTVSYEIALTYANAKYVETGDETLPEVSRDGSATVTVDKSTVADNDEGLAYAVKSTIDLLKDDPSQHGGGADDETYVSDAFGIGSVTVKDGVCTIDLTGDELMDQNMYTEKFFIVQTVDTILNSFSEISAVQFTVNGEAADSLSYMSLDGQFTRDTMAEMVKAQ